MISLIKKKPFNKITNKDITERAGFSHITIYLNFNSKDEIIKYYLDEITDEFIESSKKEKKMLYSPEHFTEYLVTLFNHLDRNKNVGILLYKADMIHHLKDEFDRIFLNKANSLNEEFTYSFISGGLYNIYYYWIKNGCKETPQELSKMFKDFYILKGK